MGRSISISVLYLCIVSFCLFSCALAFFGQSIVKSKPPPPTPPPAAPPETPPTPQGPILERGIIDYKGNTLLEKSPDDPRYVSNSTLIISLILCHHVLTHSICYFLQYFVPHFFHVVIFLPVHHFVSHHLIFTQIVIIYIHLVSFWICLCIDRYLTDGVLTMVHRGGMHHQAKKFS